jgi:hypothetical protein
MRSRLSAKYAWLNCLQYALLVGVAGGALSVRSLWAIDAFDRHDASILQQAASSGSDLKEFTERDAAKLKPLSADLEGTCLVVETNRGNLAKVLVSWGFRKQPMTDKPIPVLMLDRFVTYERDKGDSTVANGKNIMLFPGFEFDFDLGQVVPAGFDADVQLTDKAVLRPLNSVKLHGVDGSKLPKIEAASAKRDVNVITPEDFSGVWQVDGDGRWIGEWDLIVNAQGDVTGKFLSAETQASYPITGEIGGVPNQIKLQVQFNNATQLIDAYLWTKDKSKIAGSFSLSDRKFGLMATRQAAK